jgi:tetratricopeptide (TPR) repeat protein
VSRRGRARLERSRDDSPSPAARPTTLACLVFLAALAVLGVLALQYRGDPFFRTPVSDALSYHEWAQRIARDGLAAEGVFHQPPLFPVLLAGSYLPSGGVDLADRGLALGCLVGALAIGLLVPLTRSCFDSTRAGVAAAGVALLYAPIGFHALKLLPLALAFATQAAAALLTLRATQPGPAWRVAAAGLACGIACLARGEMLLFLPLAGLLVARSAPPGRRLILAVWFGVGVALVVAPVTAHNAARGDLALVSTAGGENLFIGNRRGADGGHTPLGDQAGDLFSQRAVAAETAEREAGRPLRPSEVSRFWTRRALGEIAAAPLPWLALELRKAGRILDPRDPTDMYSLSLERSRYVPALWALPLSTWGLFLLAGIGLVSVGREGRRRALPLLVLIVVQVVVLMAFFVSTRLRLPLLFLLCPLAGAGLVALLTRSLSVRATAAAGLALAATTLHWLALVPPSSRETLRLASVLSLQGRLDESLEVSRPWVEARDPLAVDHAGWVRSKLGQLPEARALYLQALELGLPNPAREAETHSRLASVLERLGELDDAAREHDAAVAVAPHPAGALYERGLFRLRRGRTPLAVDDLEQASRLAPGWQEPLRALAALGRKPQAR